MKFTTWTISSALFGGIQYSHMVVQASPVFIYRMFYSSQTENLVPFKHLICHSSVSQLREPWLYFPFLWIWLSILFKQNHKICSFCQIISPNILSSRFIYIVACVRISFLFSPGYYSVICTYQTLFIHL